MNFEGPICRHSKDVLNSLHQLAGVGEHSWAMKFKPWMSDCQSGRLQCGTPSWCQATAAPRSIGILCEDSAKGEKNRLSEGSLIVFDQPLTCILHTHLGDGLENAFN